MLAKPNSKVGTTEAIIEDFSLLEDVPFLLEELLSAVELELFDFSELELLVDFSELDDLAELELVAFSELELVGFVVSLLEEVSLLLEESVFSELEDLTELELAGFVVSLLEDSPSELEDSGFAIEELLAAEELLSGLTTSELELTELELSGFSSELELWLLEDLLSTSTDAWAFAEVLPSVTSTSIVYIPSDVFPATSPHTFTVKLRASAAAENFPGGTVMSL